MQNISKLCIIAGISAVLCGCKPGPITLGSHPVAVQDKQGQTHYVDYKVDKKQRVNVSHATGSDLVTEKIQAAFAEDPALNPYHIQVQTHRGEVTLTGTVPNDQTRSYAIKMARSVKGVLMVHAKNLVVTK